MTIDLLRLRPWDVDLDEVEISPGENCDVKYVSSLLFRVDDVNITESVPESTSISCIFVGYLSQLISLDAVLSSVFDVKMHTPRGRFDTAEPGQQILFRVKNITDKPVKWKVHLAGRCVA